jgi:hypothetical protein
VSARRELARLAGALVLSAILTDVAGAAAPGRTVISAGEINIDLDVAALVVAIGALITGLVAFGRLRSERPKIVQEVGEIAERRLRAALEASWSEVDRCRTHIAVLEAENDKRIVREQWLGKRVEVLEEALRERGWPIPPAPPEPAGV